MKSVSFPLKSFGLFVCAFALAILAADKAGAATLLAPRPEASSTEFGYALANMGDVDGDGVADLAVGTPFEDGDFDNVEKGFGPPQNVGKVYLLSGANLAVIRELNDPEYERVQGRMFGGQFGTSVAALADLTHDGVAEILVGVPHHVAPVDGVDEISAGEAFVFDGKTGALLYTLLDPTPEENTRFGYSVAGIADVNGDGVPDMAVGAPKKNVGGDDTHPEVVKIADAGIVYLFSGADGSLIRSLNPPLDDGIGANGRFGTSLANAGDSNKRVLVGAPGRRRAYVYNGETGVLLYALIGPDVEKLPSFGAAVAGGKDVNNDGIPDFVVGAPLVKNLSGAAYVFNGTTGKLLYRLPTPKKSFFAKFGSTVAFTDDITGDGRPDVLVGAPDQAVGSAQNAGSAYIFSGASGKLNKTVTSVAPKAFAGFGSAFTTSDTDGDGTLNLIIGAPFQDVDLFAEDGDRETHLAIGQIETQ
jgi:hypothetical protein